MGGGLSVSAATRDAIKAMPDAAQSELKALATKAQRSALPAEPLPSAAAIIEAIRTKKQSCVDVVTAALARIDATTELNICVDVLKDAALAKAKEVDEKIAAGTDEPKRLEGLPIVVKTNIEGPPGSLVSASTWAMAGFKPNTTAPCVERLLAEGAIVVAKVNMPELAIGLTAQSFVHGRTLNPHNYAYNAGASSSGTAAAIAAGIVSCGLGSDTGGSLRLPAGCCGVVGLRPSTKSKEAPRRWPAEGVVPVSSMRDTPGPMGASVADVCLLDSVVTGGELASKADLKGVKLAIPQDWIDTAKNGLSDSVKASLELARSALAAAGAEVATVDGMAEVIQTNKDTWPIPVIPVPFEDAYTDMHNFLERHPERPEEMKTVESLVAMITPARAKGHSGHYMASRSLSADELKAKLDATAAGIEKLEAAYRGFFAEHGVSALVMPAIPQELTKCGADNEGVVALFNEYIYAFHMNELPVPSLVMPVPKCAHAESGVPTSLLLWGIDDKQLLGIALALEEALKEAA